ncbi:CRC domain-containing protein TSO1 [Ziziphus jujuba]|uniref:CRC domain-containing protein TSO1 n=1 Tax=Ziziphus jujuba TaxID=326968 RepID=A0ABM3IPA1_ZIZJJ|nr:CRC domain-containing protein TSO1 [Ziziphus jujuba]
MESPKTDKIITSAVTTPSNSPQVQESPFSSYVSNLSPIKSVKAAHVAQGFPGLSSPPLVFTSPRINVQREASFLKRSQYPQLSSAEATQNDNRDKKSTDGLVYSEESSSILQRGLITDSKKDFDAKDSLQSEPHSSSGCIDEYLADPGEVDCLNSTYSVSPCLKQIDDTSKPSNDLKETILTCDNKSGLRADASTVVEEHLGLLEEAKKDIQGKPTSDARPNIVDEEENDGTSSECANIKSSLHVDHAIDKQDCQHSQVKDRGCSHQDDCNCTSQPLPESLQSVEAYEDFGENENAGVSNGLVENMLFHGPKANQNQRGIRRRCLQFGEASLYTTGGSNSYPEAASDTSSRLAATNAEIENAEPCRADLKATSGKRKLVKLTDCIAPSLPPPYCGNSSTFCKPSGIGLHLNSIVNAASMGHASTASIKLEDLYMGVQGKKPTSVSSQVIEKTKSFSSSLSNVEKNSAGDEEGWFETKAFTAASSATTVSPNNLEFEYQVVQDEIEKPNFQKADSFEEYDQPSPTKKRKKTSATESDGCKRCNCKKTKCLKLYCDCFAAGIYCAEPCACQGCFNRPEYEDTVLETRQQIESRNPLAFAPKIVQRVTEFPPNNAEDGSRMTPSSARHKRGCNCKKSMCLKKYCECYQANVGCSTGCRCDGCKNVYGRKEEYIAVEHGLAKEMVSNAASKKNLEDAFDGKLEMVPIKRNPIHAELHDVHDLTPLTPTFQYSDHGKNVPKSRFLSKRSPESDLFILSSYEKSSRSSTRNLEDNDILSGRDKDLLNLDSCDWQADYNIGTMDPNTPRCDTGPSVCHLTAPSDTSSTAMASCRARDWTNVSKVQRCPGSDSLSSGSSLRWRNSPVTPVTRIVGTKSLQGLESGREIHDILQDDTPEILKDSSTPIKSVKASSPNKKRVSPPHGHIRELGSSSSGALRSGRKFILKAVPSFPPLTPCIDSKGSTIQETSNLQDNNSNK